MKSTLKHISDQLNKQHPLNSDSFSSPPWVLFRLFFIFPKIRLSDGTLPATTSRPFCYLLPSFLYISGSQEQLIQLYCANSRSWERFVPCTSSFPCTASLHTSERSLYSHFLDVSPSSYTISYMKTHLFWGNDHLIIRVQLFVCRLIYP